MKELTLPRPTEKQKLFLEDRHRYLAFGGSRGGGKSFAVRMDAIIKSMKYQSRARPEPLFRSNPSFCAKRKQMSRTGYLFLVFI